MFMLVIIHSFLQCDLAANRISVKEQAELVKARKNKIKYTLSQRIVNLFKFVFKSPIRQSELRKRFVKGEKYVFDEKPSN
jgi:predicted HTH domain antitoxin